MSDIEIIARQAKRLEELGQRCNDLEETVRQARSVIICIGGPLNDNKNNYNSVQMKEWKVLLDILEEV